MRKTLYFLLFVYLLFIFSFNCCSKPSSDNIDNSSEKTFSPTPPPEGYPNSSNTGLSNPSLLSTELSSLTEVSLGWEATDGQIVENLEIKGRLILNGDSITVRNCKIWGDKADDNGYAKGYGIQILPDLFKEVLRIKLYI